MADRMQHGSGNGQSPHAHAQGQNAHVLHAGIGQHAFVVPLAYNKDGGRGQRKQAQDREHAAGNPAQTGGQHDLVAAQHAQHGAVEQRSGKQGGNQRGGLTVRVGQPVVQGGKAHFGPIAHQQKDKGRLEPGGLRQGGVAHKPAHLVHALGALRRALRAVKSHGQLDVASRARAMPTEQMIRYFQVASSELLCRWK